MIQYTTSPYIMFVIIPVVHIADHHARDAGMDELVVPEIDAHMGDSPALTQRMKKDKVPFL